jgi:predicted RNA-binding protein with PUA-like domain
MSGFWIVKSEPSAYSYADLEREGRTVWDGVRNAQALIYLRAMKKGDRVLFYHTGAEKAIVGIARVAGDPYRDPKHLDSKLAVVELVPERALPTPILLADIRKEPVFATLGLVRHTRLSVMPVTAAQWARLLALGGIK